MTPALAVLLLHGEDGLDFIYFLSALLIVALPLAVFATLTYLLIKRYVKSGETRP